MSARPVLIDEVLLVLDATTGQNGLAQTKQFTDAVGVTGIVLTKMDGTAKGGIAIGVEQELGVPVKFIGVGEGVDDLVRFEPAAFVDALSGGILMHVENDDVLVAAARRAAEQAYAPYSELPGWGSHLDQRPGRSSPDVMSRTLLMAAQSVPRPMPSLRSSLRASGAWPRSPLHASTPTRLMGHIPAVTAAS